MKPKTVIAKTDKYLDGARGLFTPHQRGFARKPVSVSIITPTMQTEVFCRESLCDIDLRTLQTIAALLTASKSPTEGKVITTMYQLAVECGLRGESTTSRTSIKRSLFRLSNSTWNYQTTCSDEDERAAQQADHDELVGIGKVRGDLLGQGLDARGDGFGGDQFVDDIGLGHEAIPGGANV